MRRSANSPCPTIPAGHLPRRSGRQRRHALFPGLAGPRRRTLRSEHSRRRRPLLHGSTDRRLDRRVPVPGTRTTGTQAQTYAITGPNWHGELPDGVTEYKSATNTVWVVGRSYTSGTPEDYAEGPRFPRRAVAGAAERLRRRLLRTAGDRRSRARHDHLYDKQVTSMNAGTYFTLLATLMKDNPPKAGRYPYRRRDSEDRLGAGQRLGYRHARPGHRPRSRLAFPKRVWRKCSRTRPNAGRNRERLASHHARRSVWHRLPAKGLLNWQGPGWLPAEDSIGEPAAQWPAPQRFSRIGGFERDCRCRDRVALNVGHQSPFDAVSFDTAMGRAHTYPMNVCEFIAAALVAAPLPARRFLRRIQMSTSPRMA